MNRPTVCLKPLLIAVLASLALASFPAPPAVTSNAAGARRIPDEGPGEKSAALTAKAGRASRNSIVEAYGKLPLSFELNRGQLYPEVRFVSRGDGYNLLLTAKEAILHLVGRQAAPASSKRKSRVRRPTSATLRMKMLGANASPRVEGLDRMTGTSNYFLGADPSKWRTQVPSYERVRYSGVYTGVDLIYYGNGRQLEFDFHVAPGASPDVIKIGLKGARRIRLADDGGLEISTAAGDVQMKKPFIYQDNEGARHEVEGGYVLLARNRIGFKIARYDETKPLIIDPVLSYSTFLGGISEESGDAIAVDSFGNAYVTGRTLSFNFPVTIDAFDTTYANGSDIFVTKLDPTGSSALYSTYLGGQGEDQGLGITVDSAGNAYITGLTTSTDYPTTSGAYQTVTVGASNGDAFVTKLNSTGTDLIYSTYLGGQAFDQGNGIAIDSSGNAFITGTTASPDFPTTQGAFQELKDGIFTLEAFITRLNASGADLVYSTFLGGSNDDRGNDIKIDADGNAYITGSTTSQNFDVTAGAFQTMLGGGTGFNLGDAFVTKVNNTGTDLIYSTFVGAGGEEGGHRMIPSIAI